MTPLTLRDRPWTIPPHHDWFETGEFQTTGLVLINFRDASKLLATNPEALKKFLEQLASETAKKVGSDDPMVADLEMYLQIHFPTPIPAERLTGQTKQPQPFGPGDGY